ncbi:MAG: hypothetical protein QOI77_2153 [Blastocatellia bacterium]|jgi:hypothetical protein|nr:hypothetical protein [Blastocatellia bacterium]
MRGLGSVEELLNKAFELAYFILGDRPASIYVAMAAMDKLKTASTNQGRRLHYTPTGRSKFPAVRTKVNLSDLHLLQRLVYIESELFERLLEGQRKTVQQDDLIIRYIKHLVRITTKHNSFYVTLGLCRLLYNYSTGDTSEIYNSVLQDPERIRDDYYYRSRKKRLMEEIKERFGSLVRSERVLRGEERFQPQEDSQKYARLVKECLIRFTPWHSACVLPRELDPKRSVITPFLFEGGDPDQEHQVELNRIHTLIHPECLARLTSALGLAAADERLELPAFFVSSEGSRPADDRFNPTELTEGELDAIRRHLEKSATHRRQVSQQQLSLLIDGKRECVFELGPSRSYEFGLQPEAELIEIRSVDLGGDYQETSLSVCLLKHDQSGILPLDSSAVLGKGPRLAIKVLPLTDDSGEGCGATLKVGYQVPAPGGAVFNLLRHIGSWRHGLIDFRALTTLRMLKPSLGVVFFALCAAGLWFYFYSRPAANPSQVAQLHEDRRGATPFVPPPQSQKEPGLPPRKTASTGSNVAQPSKAESAQEKGSDKMRGTNAIAAPAPLLAVKRVYIDPLGEDSFSQELRANLMAALQDSHRFEVVGNRDEADAVFKGSARQILTQRSSSSVLLELVNVRGQVIWSLTSQKQGSILSSNAAAASATISRVLLHDIKTLERKH